MSSDLNRPLRSDSADSVPLDTQCEALSSLISSDPSHLTDDFNLLSTCLGAALDNNEIGESALNAVLDPDLPPADAARKAVFDCLTFRPLHRAAKELLLSHLQHRIYAPGELLLSQGRPSNGLHLLLAGQVDIMDSSTTPPERIDQDGPGSVLGEMSLLTGQHCSANVIATSECSALVLSVQSYHQLREQFPEMEIALSQLVSDRLGQRSHDALCGKTLDRYRLIRCINRGAMGVVYEAQSLIDDQPFALKMLRHRFIDDERAQTRFDFEFATLRRLRSEHVVQLHGCFVAYRTRFLILDLCDGSDLRECLLKSGPLPEATVRAIMGQIALGVQTAHRQNLLHLDLKPANVLVDRRGVVKVTDFGLGQLMESDGGEQRISGTPVYMSLEQFQGDGIDHRSDYYAIGCIAYELLEGKRLFPHRDLRELVRHKLKKPTELWPATGISPELRDVIYASLAPRSSGRTLDLDLLASWARPVPEVWNLPVEPTSDRVIPAS